MGGRAILALALSMASSLPNPGAAQVPASFEAQRVRAHVAFLADDLLEGRDAGTRGYEIAARYVVAQFATLGLKPADGASFMQSVRLLRADLTDPSPQVVIDGAPVESADVSVPAAISATDTGVEGTAVFVGYGIDAPHHGMDDFAGLDLRGKIAVYLNGYPSGMPSEVGAHFAAEKAAAAAARGAIGTIEIETRASLSRRPWTTIKRLGERPVLTWIGKDGRPHLRTPALRATARLNVPAAERLFERAPHSLTRILDDVDREGIRPRGFALSAKVRIERRSKATELQSVNVVGMLPGSDAKLAQEIVLLIAHLDHDGVDPKLSGDQTYNGALDNAAGVATLIEVARGLATGGVTPKRTIVFAAVTAEEDGMIGSQFLAKYPLAPSGEQPVAVINLDMPLILHNFTDVVAFGAEQSTLGETVARAAARLGVSITPDPTPSESLFVRSDHYRFVQEGVPSIMVTTGPANGGEQTAAAFRRDHYHKPSDDLNLPIDWHAGTKFVRLNQLITAEIANLPTRPRWYETSFFGTVFAPRAAKARSR